jgi:DNA-binding NtrC family response regulator
VTKVEGGILERFQSMNWKGNIRRLENFIEYGVDNCQGDTIKLHDLEKKFADELKIESNRAETSSQEYDEEINYSEFRQHLEKVRADMEKEYYTYHLDKNKWNVLQTAKSLDMANAYLRQTMKRLRIEKR